jgi:putative ABC transport system permease protein
MNLRPRWRKVLHDLVDSRLRTALVVVSIAVGVFSIGVIAGTYVIISQDMSASYTANNPMNVDLRAGDFGSTTVDQMASAEGVRQAEGRRVFSARVRVPGTSVWRALDLVAVDDFETQRITTTVRRRAPPRQKLLERGVKRSCGWGLAQSGRRQRAASIAGIVQINRCRTFLRPSLHPHRQLGLPPPARGLQPPVPR